METNRLDVAIALARDAGQTLKITLGDQLPYYFKSEGHIAMPIDETLDKRIVSTIRERFPNDGILSEESGLIPAMNQYLWVIDPVDGTSNLKVGLPYAATAIAVQKSGQTFASVVYNPFTDQLYAAEKGAGASRNGQRLKVSDQRDKMVGYYAQGYRVPQTAINEIQNCCSGFAHRMLYLWAPTLDFCAIAAGAAEFLIGLDTETLDAIPGALILEEAGGHCTDWQGGQLKWDCLTRERITLLASNGAVHQTLQDALKRICLPAVWRGWRSQQESGALDRLAAELSQRIPRQVISVADRISSELGVSEPSWRFHTDLGYLCDRAEHLRNAPVDILMDIFDRTAPLLSGNMARDELLRALENLVREWNPEADPVEALAQALEIAASDIRMHEQASMANVTSAVIEQLSSGLSKDSMGVGRRLKRNAFREVKALVHSEVEENLAPPQKLEDVPIVQSAVRTSNGGVAGIIITGGRGTRLRTSVPKALVPLAGRPLLDYVIEAFRGAGVQDLGVVIGYKSLLHELQWPKLPFLPQDEQKGTAHAIWMARGFLAHFSGSLLVSYSDMPLIQANTLQSLVDKHKKTGAAMTFLSTSRKNHPEFGRIFRRNGTICRIGQVRFEDIESDEVDAGFYCFEAPLFWQYLGQVRNANNRREFVLTDIVSHLSNSDQHIETLFIDDPIQTIGINRPSELVQAEYEASKRAGATSNHPMAEPLMKLRFYENYGGMRWSHVPYNFTTHQRRRLESIAASFDNDLDRFCGTVYRCPAFPFID